MKHQPLLILLVLHLLLLIRCSYNLEPVLALALSPPHLRTSRKQHHQENARATRRLRRPTISSFTSTVSSSLCSSNSNSIDQNQNVEVSIVQSNNDILSLANIRYQEWMITNDNESDSDHHHHPPPPSIQTFRLATAEIYQERSLQGSLVFLAKTMNNSNSNNSNKNDDDDSLIYNDKEAAKSDISSVSVVAVVGAAELSPIELKDVIISTNLSDSAKQRQQQQQQLLQQDNHNIIRYVTDVVTSSSSRRLGIGSLLMNTLEKTAWEMFGTRCLLLHVERCNLMARRFYEKLNYVYVISDGDSDVDDDDDDDDDGTVLLNLKGMDDDELLITIDTNRLAMNAGTTGQLLMIKELSEPDPVLEEKKEKEINIGTTIIKNVSLQQVGKKGGFGTKQITRKNEKKKKRSVN